MQEKCKLHRAKKADDKMSKHTNNLYSAKIYNVSRAHLPWHLHGIMDMVGWLVDWLGFNSAFTQERRYCALKVTISQLTYINVMQK